VASHDEGVISPGITIRQDAAVAAREQAPEFGYAENSPAYRQPLALAVVVAPGDLGMSTRGAGHLGTGQ
jgi:hypothetical protein